MPYTVFNAINLSINGTLDSLGPVRIDSIGVTKKSDKNQKSFRTIKVSDGSGGISIMMWEPSCFLPLAPGQTVVFSGQMKREEFPVGTPKLRSEGGISITGPDGGAITSPPPSAPAGSAPQSGAASAGNRRASAAMTALIDYGLAWKRVDADLPARDRAWAGSRDRFICNGGAPAAARTCECVTESCPSCAY